MNPSFQLSTFLVFPIIAHTALSSLACALTPMSDNFSDNLLDLSKWDVLFGNGSIGESSGRLNYTVSDPSQIDGGFDFAQLSYPPLFNPANPGSNPGSNENWQVIVDVTNTSTPVSLGEISSAGVQIYDADYGGDFIFLELYSSTLDELPMRRGFVSSLGTDGVDVPGSDIDTGNLPGQTTGSLKIAYNGTSKVVTTYYDTTGSSNGFQWVQLASYGLNGSGGANGNTNWALSSSGFVVSIYGYSELMVLTPGQVELDNFSLTENPANQEITVEQPAGTALPDESSSVRFETSSVGSPVIRTFTIRNDGQQPLTGLALSKAGANAANFTLGTLGAASLAAGASTTFNVTCTPQAGTPQTASLRIASNDADEKTFEIALSASVLTANGDDFNDNTNNPSKWDTDITFGTDGLLAETSSRLQYTSSTAAGDNGTYRPWILNQATYDKDWEVIMDVGNSISLPTGPTFRDTGIGIEIFPPATFEQSFFTEMNSSGWESDSFHGFISGQGEDESGAFDQEVSSPGASGSIRILFNSTAKVITTYCDTDGSANGYSWTPLGTLRINGFGDYAADWNMSGSDAFQIAVYGFVDGAVVTGGQLTADNFSMFTPASGVPVTPLQIWRIAKFGSTSAPETALDFDADKDGLKNLIEYAFKLEPEVPGTPVLPPLTGTRGLPRITPEGSGPSQRLRLEYVRKKASSNPGISYIPQFSSNLQGGGWSAITGPETIESIDTEWERVAVEDTAGTGLPNRFGRVVVTAP